jgi:hypothetical protein
MSLTTAISRIFPFPRLGPVSVAQATEHLQLTGNEAVSITKLFPGYRASHASPAEEDQSERRATTSTL